tara:strand:- start:1224 stop:1781 length:558 start_codon:yes stop_codon:yes gene_type:complete
MRYEETIQAYSAFGKYVVQQGRTNLTKKTKKPNNYTKSLYNSLKYASPKESNGKITLSFFMDVYGMFQDAGVYGSNPSLVKKGKQKGKATNTIFGRYSYKSKMPPLKPIMNWAKFNKIRFRDKKTGQFKKGNYKAIGFMLQKRIFAQGITPSLWFTRPFRAAFKRLPEELAIGFSEDVLNFLKKR